MTEDRMRQALAARRLLDDELLAVVLLRMREDYVQAWARTKDADKDTREHAWTRYQLLNDFLAHLQIIAEEKEFIDQH
jgi:hypothetical protein